MTMQIKDSFYHADREFSIIACSIPLHFDPSAYTIVPALIQQPAIVVTGANIPAGKTGSSFPEKASFIQ